MYDGFHRNMKLCSTLIIHNCVLITREWFWRIMRHWRLE